MKTCPSFWIFDDDPFVWWFCQREDGHEAPYCYRITEFGEVATWLLPQERVMAALGDSSLLITAMRA